MLIIALVLALIGLLPWYSRSHQQRTGGLGLHRRQRSGVVLLIIDALRERRRHDAAAKSTAAPGRRRLLRRLPEEATEERSGPPRFPMSLRRKRLSSNRGIRRGPRRRRGQVDQPLAQLSSAQFVGVASSCRTSSSLTWWKSP